jgi:hypothetical protein
MRTALLSVLALIALSSAVAQTQSGETFKTGVTAIQVPVVVRDRDGHVVSNLGKDDFQLFDNGKRQEISSFSVDNPGGQAAPDRSLPDAKAPAAQSWGGMGMDSRALHHVLLRRPHNPGSRRSEAHSRCCRAATWRVAAR